MRLFVLTLLICGSAAAQTAAMYRTVAADGTVTFSDVPLSANSQMITVLVRSGTARSAETTAPDRSSTPADEALAAERAENCALARDQAASLENSNRLYRVLPSGERQFMTDEEIAAAREQAAAEIAQWCQPSG